MLSACSLTNKQNVGFEAEPFKIVGDSSWYQLTDNPNYVKVEIRRKTGEVRKQYFLNDGLMDSTLTYWFTNGTIEKQGFYKLGSKEGLWSEYYYYNHNIAKQETYKDDMLNGEVIEYHSNGNKKSMSTYVNGVKQGKLYEWWENGNLKSDMSALDDEPHGNALLYHSNGQLNAIGQFFEGKRVGKFEFFYDNGNKQKIVNYKDGEMHGKITVWKQNGDLLMEGIHENGELIEEKTY